MKELTINALRENLPEVTAFVEAQLEAVGCPMKAQMQFAMAVDELFVNIASYAYAPGRGDVTVRFAFDADARRATLTFIDGGTPYDPLAKPDPDITLGAGERPIGGLGIFLVKKTMDDMRYERRDGKNVLTIAKAI